MSLKKRGDQYYGAAQSDLHDGLRLYAAHSYPIAHIGDARCPCGSAIFRLLIDDAEGVAVRICDSCRVSHAIGDGEEFLEHAELEECQCPCGCERLEVSAGVSLYQDDRAVRWFYLGCRCPSCGLIGVYGDWKNEHDDYSALLGNL